MNGDLIRVAREQKGWSQADLATKAGISQTLVSFWERGLREDTSIRRLTRVARALELPVNDLIADADPQHTTQVLPTEEAATSAA